MSDPAKSPIDAYVIQRVKEMREARGITQSELATMLDISNGFIGQVESPNYRAKYNIKHLNRLAIIFKCSFAEFFPDKPFEA